MSGPKEVQSEKGLKRVERLKAQLREESVKAIPSEHDFALWVQSPEFKRAVWWLDRESLGPARIALCDFVSRMRAERLNAVTR